MDYISIQKERYQRHLEAELAKQKIIEENKQAILKKLEEEKLAQERKEKEEHFSLFIIIKKLDDILNDIAKCKDIIQMNMFIASFKFTLEQNITLFIVKDKIDQVQSYVIKMIGLITEINFSYQYPKLSAYEKRVIDNLEPKMKEILLLVNMDSSIVSIQTMDTSNDEQLAKQLAQKFKNFYI
jgi:predicted membrane chloride channel (bestrophin family)